jgi:hypothetical protein
MTAAIQQPDLHPGDVLLSLGDGRTSDAIRQFDGGRYSHAALWTGDGVIESTTPRVVEHSLDRSLSDHPRRYVDVFRCAALDAPQRSSVVTAARTYADRRYAYEHLALGALVIATSAWLPSEEHQLRWLMQACDIHQFLKLDRATAGQLVTCTELVARAYAEAGAALQIRPTPAGRFDLGAFFAGAAALVQGAKRGPSESWQEPVAGDEWQELRALVRARYAELARAAPSAPGSVTRGIEGAPSEPPLERQIRAVVRAKYFELTGVDLPESDAAPAERTRGLDVVYFAGKNWSASLVTPRYLEMSPTLARVGRLVGEPDELRPEPPPGAVLRGSASRSRG